MLSNSWRPRFLLALLLLGPAAAQAANSVYQVGVFNKQTATGTQTVAHTLGVTPKALILWTALATGTAFTTTGVQFGVGFTDGTTSRSVSYAAQGAAATTNCSRVIATTALTVVKWGEVTSDAAAFSSWNTSGFTLNWTTNDGTANEKIHFLIIGGSDISAKVIDWTMLTAAGSTTVTGVGFQPDSILQLNAGSGFTGALGTPISSAAFSMGVVDANAAQASMEILDVDNVTTSDTQRFQSTSDFLVAFDNGLNLTKEANLTAMTSDGFTVNFSTANTNAAKVVSLALKGLNTKAGFFNKTTGTAPVTQAITGLGFQPAAIMFGSAQDVTEAAPQPNARIGFGAVTSSAQGSTTYTSTDNLATSSVRTIDSTTAVIMKVNADASTVTAQATLQSFDTDGYTLKWTTNDAVATEEFFLAFGPLSVVTSANLKTLKAERAGDQVRVSWETGAEAKNLGFNVYRGSGSGRVRVNNGLVAGSALLSGHLSESQAARRYQVWDTLPAGASQPVYTLEAVDVSGHVDQLGTTSTEWSSLLSQSAQQVSSAALSSLAKASGAASAPQPASLAFAARNSALASAQHNSALAVARTDQGSAALRGAGLLGAGLSIDPSTGPALRMSVSSPGVYRVTQESWVAAGMSAAVDPRHLELLSEGQQVALKVIAADPSHFQPGDYLEFYGTGIDTLYSGRRVYWLAEGGDAAARWGSAPLLHGRVPACPSYPAVAIRRDRSVYFAALTNGDVDNFFGAVVIPGADASLSLATPDAQACGGAAQVRVVLQGVTDAAHQVSVSLNGSAIGSVVWQGRTLGEATFDLPATLTAQTALTLSAAGGASDISTVERVELTYPRAFAPLGPSTWLQVAAGSTVSLAPWGADARVVDVTEESAPLDVPVSNASVTAAGSGDRTLVVLTAGASPSAVLTPDDIRLDTPSDLRGQHSSPAADVVLIGPAAWLSQADNWAAIRASQGLTVARVDIEDVYDEFNFGEKSAPAIPAFLAYAKAHWTVAPRFVVLLGDATFDPRDFLALGDHDVVPTRLLATTLMETASDGALADVDGDGLADLAIGRLPARTVDEAKQLLDRSAAAVAPTASRPGALLMAGAPADVGDDFDGASATFQTALGTGVDSQIISATGSDAASQLASGWAQSPWVVGYFGHGSVESWAGGLLDSTSAEQLHASAHQPLVVDLTCLNGFFQDVYTESLAESLLSVPGGGAAAVWASSTTADADPQAALGRAFFGAVTQSATLGEAILAAKAQSSNTDVLRSYNLLGDPSVPLLAVASASPAAVSSPAPVAAGNSVTAAAEKQGCSSGFGGGAGSLLLVGLSAARFLNSKRRLLRSPHQRSGR